MRTEEEMYTWLKIESTSLLHMLPLSTGEKLVHFFFLKYTLFALSVDLKFCTVFFKHKRIIRKFYCNPISNTSFCPQNFVGWEIFV